MTETLDPASNTRAIAHYICEANKREFPDAVLNAGRVCLVDWIGVCTGAQSEPAASVVAAVSAAWCSTGRSTLLLGGKSSSPVAALCNGTLAHCLDFDDTYVSANTHTSAPVWAATLALGEDVGASEAEMLRAFITGFEVSARVGRGLGEAVTARGWHATGAFGRIGAAAACAMLLRLDATATANALGAATTQISGLVGSFGTMAKPFHAGKAAMDGVMSAQLAAGGFQAGRSLLEAGGGLDNALIQDRSHTIETADFSNWEILNNSIKLYAACHLTHPLIDAARGVHIDSVDLSALTSVVAHVAPLAMKVTGGKSGAPATSLEAKFDLRYCVALALHGYALSAADFIDGPLHDQAVLATAAKVSVQASDAYGYSSGLIELNFSDGRKSALTVATAKGHPGNPAQWDDMRRKFESLVDPAAGARTQEIFDALRTFGKDGRALAMIRQLAAALQA